MTRHASYPRRVTAIRLLLAQRRSALLLCAIALLLKLLVPTGYMLAQDHGRVTLVECSGIGPAAARSDMPAMHAGMADHDPQKDHGRSDTPCSFAGLSAAVLVAIDPVQLQALIAFVMAAGVAPAPSPMLGSAAHLRPPLRGPPAHL